MDSSGVGYLPQPSNSFIRAYVEAQGNIKEVLVEYEIDYVANATPPTKPWDPTVYLPKVNPEDNTITIEKVKDSWSREEVIELLDKAINDTDEIGRWRNREKWIQDNL